MRLRSPLSPPIPLTWIGSPWFVDRIKWVLGKAPLPVTTLVLGKKGLAVWEDGIWVRSGFPPILVLLYSTTGRQQDPSRGWQHLVSDRAWYGTLSYVVELGLVLYFQPTVPYQGRRKRLRRGRREVELFKEARCAEGARERGSRGWTLQRRRCRPSLPKKNL